MHKMLTVTAQDVHREQVVGQQHDLSLGDLAVGVCVFLLHKHATTHTVGISAWGFRALELPCVLAVCGWQLDGCFSGDYRRLASERQGIGYLPKELTPVTDAGVL